MITVTEEPANTLVRVDGWLSGEGAAELLRVLDSAAAPPRLLVHNLRGADEAGLSALRRLADEGTPLDGLSTYIRLLLANRASPGPTSSPAITRSRTPVRRSNT